MNKPKITIRFGAGVRTVTVDGHTFDRNSLTKAEDNKLRRMVTAGWQKWQEGNV